jgi:hypothetical protein
MLELPTLCISLHRDHAATPGDSYIARFNGGILAITEMPHRDRDRFVAVLSVEVDGADAEIEYKVRAATIPSLECALRKATQTAAGANALSILSIVQSVRGRAA